MKEYPEAKPFWVSCWSCAYTDLFETPEHAQYAGWYRHVLDGRRDGWWCPECVETVAPAVAEEGADWPQTRSQSDAGE